MKKYQEELTKAQGKQRGRVVQQPMTSQEYQEKVKQGSIDQCLDEEGGLVIKPDQGIVLKLFDKHSIMPIVFSYCSALITQNLDKK